MRTHTKEHTFFCSNASNHLIIFFLLCHYEPYARWCVASRKNICARPNCVCVATFLAIHICDCCLYGSLFLPLVCVHFSFRCCVRSLALSPSSYGRVSFHTQMHISSARIETTSSKTMICLPKCHFGSYFLFVHNTHYHQHLIDSFGT